MALTRIPPRSPPTVSLAARSLAGQRSRHTAALFRLGSCTVARAARSVPGLKSRHSAALFRREPSCLTSLATCFSSARHSSASSDKKLLEVIQSEIQCAVESNEQDVPVTPPEGFPFKIEDNPGESIIILKREYDGETITVEVNMPGGHDLATCENEIDDSDAEETGSDSNDAEDEGGDNDAEVRGSDPYVPLTVRVMKSNGAVLEFSCTAFPDEITIDALSMKNPEISEDDIAYEGPDFSELDDKLQRAFHRYLKIRGIKPSTTNFLHKYMINKDNREYLKWLNQLKKFIKA